MATKKKINESLTPWLYGGVPFSSEMIDKNVGFIYLITFPDGMWYVGRKLFWSTTRKKVAGRKNRKVVRKESDWQNYMSSSDHVKTKMLEQTPTREIIHLCESKREMCWWEAYEIINRRTGMVDLKALNKQCPAIRGF